MKQVVIDDGPLTLDAVARCARGAPVRIAPARLEHVGRVRDRIEALLGSGAPTTYGVNTGFGALSEVQIARGDLERLQLNLIRSHATGCGAAYDRPTTRAMILLRASVLLKGTSGVRPVVPELLVAMLNAGVHPVIPEQGSVGASGDLAPLAHLALVLVGEGEAEVDGRVMSGAEALKRAGLAAIRLEAKEGVALINGTQAMTADMACVLPRAEQIARVSDVVGAISLDALLGSVSPFDARIQTARPHPGQVAVAGNIRRLLAGSAMLASHADCKRVQDAYSLRCMPQVHGASRDAIGYVRTVVERECDSATDNPLVFEEGDEIVLVSGGNFHGQPVALVADFLKIGLAEFGCISERRVERLLNPDLSYGLPAFLTADSGLNCGMMNVQVTAAALVSENKVLAHPASVDNIPSSAAREDHVSMGTIAARQARVIATHVEHALAIELLCAVQAIDLRRPLRSSPAIEAACALVRSEIETLVHDRFMPPDIEAAARMVRDGRLLDAVEAVIGPLA